jgi:hypothetical protein
MINGEPANRYPQIDDEECKDENDELVGGSWANAVYTNNEYEEPCLPEETSNADEHCKYWAHMGVCDTHDTWMKLECDEYCGDSSTGKAPFKYEENCEAWPDEECTDENCEFWAS